MSHETLISALYVFALAAFLGYLVISRVPPLLHTPLDVGDQRDLRNFPGRFDRHCRSRLQHRLHHSRLHRSGLFNHECRGRIRDHGSHAANV